MDVLEIAKNHRFVTMITATTALFALLIQMDALPSWAVPAFMDDVENVQMDIDDIKARYAKQEITDLVIQLGKFRQEIANGGATNFLLEEAAKVEEELRQKRIQYDSLRQLASG